MFQSQLTDQFALLLETADMTPQTIKHWLQHNTSTAHLQHNSTVVLLMWTFDTQ